MRKRILLVLGAMLAILAGGIWFAAEESYVLNIKATLSTALDVTPHGDWNLGVVYAQQKYDADLAVELSSSAKADPNLSSVAYNVGCNKPSPIGNGKTAAGPVSLCPYVSIIDNDPENSLPGQNLGAKANSFVSGNIGLSAITQPHLWKIQVDPPTCVSQKDPNKQGPVDGSCDQDNPLFLAGVVFVQLAAVNQDEKVPCAKDGQTPECLPDLVVVITSAVYHGSNNSSGAQSGVSIIDTCTIDWTVTNQANQKEAVAGASTTKISLTVSNTTLLFATPELGPKESHSAAAIIPANGDSSCAGTAEADSSDGVKESNEGNNTIAFFINGD